MFKLIIVDDEPIAAEQLAVAYNWNMLGFEISGVFNSGKAALEYIKNNSVDALLSDVKMPNITGIDLAKKCYEEYPDISVVLISAYRDFEHARQALKYNVVDYILKPIKEQDFLESITKLYDHLNKQQQVIDRPSKYSNNMIINEAVSYVKEHYHEDLTIEILAKHVMLSPEYFGAYFKKNYGQNFLSFLRETRMNAACELLYNLELNISVIAEMVGYKSPSHFYEIFQNHFGMTPSQFRKQLNK